jgi:hypothetical protein
MLASSKFLFSVVIVLMFHLIKNFSLLRARDYTALNLIHLINNTPPFGTNGYIYLHYDVARNSIVENQVDVSHLTNK